MKNLKDWQELQIGSVYILSDACLLWVAPTLKYLAQTGKI